MRYAEAAQREVHGQGQAEETQERLHQLRSKMDELAAAKADRVSVDRALQARAQLPYYALRISSDERV